jgi:rhodanese-related sulfurtransferase
METEAKKATEKLNELGFKKYTELDGGFMKWSDEGLNKKNKILKYRLKCNELNKSDIS